MTLAPLKQAQQTRAGYFGPQLISPAQVAPTGSSTLWTVSGGTVLITSVTVVVVTAMSGTATTLNIGTAGGPTTLLSAGVLTSLAAGAILSGIPVLTSPGVGSVAAAAGTINWIASAGNTGTCQVYLSYLPLDQGALIQ